MFVARAGRRFASRSFPVCGACAGRVEGLLPVHLGTLRVLGQGLRMDPDHLGRLAIDDRALAEARALLERFQRFHLGVELRSERFLNEVLPIGAPASA